MPKYFQEREDETGWSREILPIMRGYKMACCDCGLVHNMQFDVFEITKFNKDGSFKGKIHKGKKWRVMLKAQRNNRATGQVRRHKKDTPHD